MKFEGWGGLIVVVPECPAKTECHPESSKEVRKVLEERGCKENTCYVPWIVQGARDPAVSKVSRSPAIGEFMCQHRDTDTISREQPHELLGEECSKQKELQRLSGELVMLHRQKGQRG